MLNKTRAGLGTLNVLVYLAPFYINIKPHLHVAQCILIVYLMKVCNAN
jgi:hypothetical protein